MENILLRGAALTPPSVTNGAATRESCHMEIEPVSLQRLSQNVSMIIVGADVLNHNLTISNQLAELQVAPLDVARPLARLLILGELDRSLVVHV